MINSVSEKEPTPESRAQSEVVYLCAHCGAPATEFHPVDDAGVCNNACYRAALAEAEETKDVYENFSRRDVLAFAMGVFLAAILVGLPLWAAVKLLSGK